MEAKKVITEKYFYGETYYCPSCKENLGRDHEHRFLKDVNFCWKCGHPLDWCGTSVESKEEL